MELLGFFVWNSRYFVYRKAWTSKVNNVHMIEVHPNSEQNWYTNAFKKFLFFFLLLMMANEGFVGGYFMNKMAKAC